MAQTSSGQNQQTFGSALVKTWLAVAVTDALFASSTGMLIPPAATPARVFRGVASVPFGKGMLDGGAAAALIGLAMHFGVALIWSTIFVLAVKNIPVVRDSLESWPRTVVLAAIYGVSIWLIMTWIVIPAFLHKPPTFTTKYWAQLIGHPIFVVGPMILVNRRSFRG